MLSFMSDLLPLVDRHVGPRLAGRAAWFHSVVLRKNYRRVRPEPDIAAERHVVAVAALKRDRVEARALGERRTVAAPVAIQPHPPAPTARQSDAIGVVASIGEVKHDNHVVAGPAVLPAMKRDHGILRIDMIHVDLSAFQPARRVAQVAAEMDQVAVEVPYSGETLGL